MDQPTFADLEYQGKKRKTRRELFLGADGRPDSLAETGGAYPAPTIPSLETAAGPTPCR